MSRETKNDPQNVKAILNALEGRPVHDSESGAPGVGRAIAFHRANAALIGIEKRLSAIHPKVLNHLIATEAPRALLEEYKNCLDACIQDALLFMLHTDGSPKSVGDSGKIKKRTF